MTYENIIHREVDDSFVITKDGLPYHVPNEGEYAVTWKELKKYAEAHPDKITEEYPLKKTLDELKADKLTELETSFDSVASGSFTCSLGYPMQFNRSDALAVQGAVMLMEASGAESGYLTDAQDVTHYDVPLADIKTVLLEMLGEYARCHELKQTYRAQVNACETEEALNAVTFSWESD